MMTTDRYLSLPAATIAATLLLAACDTASAPAPTATEVLGGTVVALLETGDTEIPPTAAVTVWNDRGDTTEVAAAADGSWVATGLTQGPYDVRAEAPGFTGLTVEGVDGGTEELVTRVVERSTAQVLRVEARYRDRDDCGGQAGCMDVTFTADADGLFSSRFPRRVFRLFVGNSPEISPDEYQEEVALLITDDNPLLERTGDEIRIRVESIYALDFEALRISDMFVYIAGATEHSLSGFLVDEGAGLGFPDLSEAGASASVQR